MAAYQTQQRKRLLAYLSAHADEPLSVAEIAAGLRAADAGAPGTSTVYRQMERLVEEGAVKRFVRGHSRQFLYQLTGGEPCRHHLHLKCVKCGQLEHLDAALSARIENEVRTESRFALDRSETVLYGCCKRCMESEDAPQ